MRLGIVTYNLLKDWDLETIVSGLGELGYEGVELRTTHAHGVEPSLSASEREQVRRMFENSPVRLVSLGSVCEFHSPDPAERARQVEIGKSFVDLASDTGAMGVKVRPNALPPEVAYDTTVANIAGSLRELGDYAAERGVEIWLEVHGQDSSRPEVIADIMRATERANVGCCWNSNATDIVDGSIRWSFDLLRPWIKNVHINELANDYPWRELFGLLRNSGYDRFTLCEAQECTQTERFLRYYRALWMELTRQA